MKLEMMLHRNINNTTNEKINIILNIPKNDSIENYLGLPAKINLSKAHYFKFILDKVVKRLKGWKRINLTFVGRAIVIKDFARTIPTCIIIFFLIPKSTCKKWKGLSKKIDG